MQRADVAMYVAKERAARRTSSTTSSSDPNAPERLDARRRPAHGIEDDELVLHYQPKVDLAHRRASIGVEALVRWQHPERGLLEPGRVHRARRAHRR